MGAPGTALTRHIDGGAAFNDPAVGPHTVPTRGGGLHFEADIFLCGVHEFQVCCNDICERT